MYTHIYASMKMTIHPFIQQIFIELLLYSPGMIPGS